MKKDGWQNGKQRYKCKACGKRFDGGKRLQNDELWTAYSAGKQTAAQLAKQYGCSSKTIYRRLRSVQIRERYPLPEKANIIMDTTYFGRSFGVMVLMDSISQQALSVDEVKYETNALYAA
ncbi:helix-turn-helix domain-containing protein, partial [Cardiobacterium hominis]